MRVGYADHAGVAGRRGYAPATQARCDGEGGDSRKRSLQEGKGKTDALTLLSQAYFSECCQGQALRARKRDLDRDRIPAFSKAGIQAIPLPATAATPLSPRRPPPMRVGYADHAGVAGRRGLHTKRSLQEGKGKTDALTLLSQAYFSECCQGQALRARKRDLDRDRIPAFSKAGIQAIPLPATAATPLSPRRPPPPMRVGYADHAGVAGRRGYAPATQARCDGEGRDFTPNAVSKRVRAKLMPLPSYRKRIFRSAVKVKPFGRASATLTEIEYPLLVKRVFKPSPSPPPRLRR